VSTYCVTGSFEGEEAAIVNEDGKLSGFPSVAVAAIELERDRLLATHGSAAGTPTGPFYSAQSPEALFLTILSVIDSPEVVGDPPVIPRYGDELG
jgi:hypothetical protein